MVQKSNVILLKEEVLHQTGFVNCSVVLLKDPVITAHYLGQEGCLLQKIHIASRRLTPLHNLKLHFPIEGKSTPDHDGAFSTVPCRKHLSILCLALWHCGITGPVGARDSPLSLTGKTCKALARSMLWNVSSVLEMDHLFSGFDCKQQNAEVHRRTQTVAVCTPQVSDCAHRTVLNIDENECLQKIQEDLHYYRETFQAYLNTELTNTLVRSIDDLIQNCFSVSVMENSPDEVSMDHQKSFQERLQLCKVLKGFNLRTITINRVFNYILEK
ncbi:uncharacterized protein zmp:0000001127 [Pseudorasbora parva]|uniref:uncharacterized protein zmp:0000001127 n=1 Tax=Pseudorasbora parva TaxID=51549 RepID=UPI00351EA5E0